jgi:hypothetical protein
VPSIQPSSLAPMDFLAYLLLSGILVSEPAYDRHCGFAPGAGGTGFKVNPHRRLCHPHRRSAGVSLRGVARARGKACPSQITTGGHQSDSIARVLAAAARLEPPRRPVWAHSLQLSLASAGVNPRSRHRVLVGPEREPCPGWSHLQRWRFGRGSRVAATLAHRRRTKSHGRC